MIDLDQEIPVMIKAILNLPDDCLLEITPIIRGGSTRSFYRVRYRPSEPSIIFVHYRHEQRENTLYVAHTAFLQSIDVEVPRILHHDAQRGFILMEDLGERDLWHYRRESWDKRRTYYQKTLAMILRLHACGPQDPRTAGLSLMEPFDPALYRWERNYFRENFVRSLCCFELSDTETAALENELARLGSRLGTAAAGLVHRDLQSQNIMIRNEEPVLIDYQGMRFGNPCYDLGSLLYDPYVILEEPERRELLHYYYDHLDTPPLSREDFQEAFHLAAAQRLMQALGAYGYLGRGIRPHFLTHIPAGLANLIEVTEQTAELPRLGALARRCQATLAAQNFKTMG